MILLIIISVVGIAPFSVAFRDASRNLTESGTGFDWEFFFESMFESLQKPLGALKKCILDNGYRHVYIKILEWTKNLTSVLRKTA